VSESHFDVNKYMNKKTIARQIAIMRQDNGLTQSELGELMQVSVRTVSGWETGDRPPKNGETLLRQIAVELRIAYQKEDMIFTEEIAEGLKESSQANLEGETERMFTKQLIEAQAEIILLMKKINSLENELSEKKAIPLVVKKGA